MIPDLSDVPQRPGVYIFKGRGEKVLYVGKAKNLRNRLRSYFQESAALDQRKLAMVRQVRDFSTVVTDTELEALILEANLIKQYKPRFNIILRDDKNYPYLCLTVTEEWPRIEVVRRIRRDGNLYFGPYVPAQGMWEVLSFIRRNFFIRRCGYNMERRRRPCVQHQMKRCPAPCAGGIGREEYLRIVRDVELFLRGEKGALIDSLEEKMQRLADELRFEEAAKIRDRVTLIRKAFESQKIIAPELEDLDIIGSAHDGDRSALQILFVRNGMLIGTKSFVTDNLLGADDPEILHSFIELFYTKEIIPPGDIIVNVLPDLADDLGAFLSKRRGEEVRIRVPQEGKERELLGMANENAGLALVAKKRREDETPRELQERLGLCNVPLRIGAFDASTIQGGESVGAFVFWEKGEFRKELYRHLRIKTVEGVDDYSMIGEIVRRVLEKGGDVVPDLIVIDGGKGQLEIARKAMEEMGVRSDVIAVAKKPDRAFLTDGTVVELGDRSRSSLLLRKIRDEVHRFAIGFHRKLRDKRLMESPLEQVPGIGKQRRLALLRAFGSIERIRSSGVDDIAGVKGFSRPLAEKLLDALRKKETI
ncbi:MAG TPA: excinuclease ABC subunit UvrC [Dissulfurispiraceae bacterium]|nr:excinuclease ABC subunit UvrC [Dissulfurispiraceae bacterium]